MKRYSFLAGLTFLLIVPSARGAKTVIEIPNGSFETPVQSVGGFTYERPNPWQEVLPNDTSSFVEHIQGFASTGNQHLGLAQNGSSWIDLGTTLEAGQTYSLIVGVGNRDSISSTPSNASTFQLQLRDGFNITTLASRTVNAGTQVAPGTFRNFNVVYTAPLSPPAGMLRIRLQVDSADRAHFDNVHLVSSRPEIPYAGFTDSRQTPPGPQAPVPAFDSRPSAEAVLFLDFDGADIDPGWEWNRGLPFTVAHSGLSSFEISRACEAVKEDFLPFNISVTTNPARYASAPFGRRMRCIITPTNRWLLEELGFSEHQSDTGIAPARIDNLATRSPFQWAGRYNDESGWKAFSYNRDVPCFMFSTNWAGTNLTDSGLDVANVISHEFGHTLGLFHDSRSPATEYFAGHGTTVALSGPIGLGNLISTPIWSPIMGRYGFITQWSRGEYAGAYNWIVSLQDDVAVIAANGFGYATDDFGNDAGSSTPVSVGGGSIVTNGFIGRTPSGGLDEDWLSFTLPDKALVRFSVKPSEPFTDGNPNVQMDKNLGIADLNARLDVWRASGTHIISAVPTNDIALPDPATPAQRLKLTDALRVKLDQVLDAGTYRLQIRGFGFAEPATNGYSDYGSMGAWSLDAGIFYYPVVNSPLSAVATRGEPFSYNITASNNPTGYHATDLPAGLGVNTAGLISGTPTVAGSFSVTISATNSAGTDSRILNLVVGPGVTEAVDTTELAFSFIGQTPWRGQTSVSHDGVDAAQSGAIGDNQNSTMQTSVTGPGNLTFWWKVDSESGFDFLEVRIDGVLQTSISGSVNWVQRSYSVGSGTHFFSWTYVKDSSAAVGADAGWVDEVVWTPAVGAPVVTNPDAITWTAGQLISYPITATNSPTSWNLTGALPTGLVYSSADHLILGFPTRPGTWPVTLSATNATGTGQKVMTITVESSYAKWARDRGLVGPDAAPTADYEDDGRSNLLERALNLNPNARDAGFNPITVNPATRRLTATFTRVGEARDLLYEVQVTNDMKTWTTIASAIDGFAMVSQGAFSVTETGGALATVTVVDNVAPPSVPTRAMRIKITQL